MNRDARMRLLSSSLIKRDIYRLVLSAPGEFLEDSRPGMFVQVEIPPGPFPLLRRPFTISRVRRDEMEIILQVKGTGTQTLARLATGVDLQVLGPLGNGYRPVKGHWLLIAGGLGAAGFPYLADNVDFSEVLCGASTSDRLLEIPCDSYRTVTEDGSCGRKGLVTDLLDTVRWGDFRAIALCGPVAMMKAVVDRMPVNALEITQVSAEARMGCGWGACEGCSVPAAEGGYLKCCSDGPVIPASEIDWTRWEGV